MLQIVHPTSHRQSEYAQENEYADTVPSFVQDLCACMQGARYTVRLEDAPHFVAVQQDHIHNARAHGLQLNNSNVRMALWRGAVCEAIVQLLLREALRDEQMPGWALLRGEPHSKPVMVNGAHMHFGGAGYNVYFTHPSKRGTEIDAIAAHESGAAVLCDAVHCAIGMRKKLRQPIDSHPHIRVRNIMQAPVHLLHIIFEIHAEYRTLCAQVAATVDTSMVLCSSHAHEMQIISTCMEACFPNCMNALKMRQYLTAACRHLH